MHENWNHDSIVNIFMKKSHLRFSAQKLFLDKKGLLLTAIPNFLKTKTKSGTTIHCQNIEITPYQRRGLSTFFAFCSIFCFCIMQPRETWLNVPLPSTIELIFSIIALPAFSCLRNWTLPKVAVSLILKYSWVCQINTIKKWKWNKIKKWAF